MGVIDIKFNPTRRDLTIFAVMWVVFFVVIGQIAFFTDVVIERAAIFTTVCLLVSLAFNREYPLARQAWGVIIPAFLWLTFAFERWGNHSGIAWIEGTRTWLGIRGSGAQWLVLSVVAGVGVIGTVVMLASRDAARTIYRVWMFAALPIGWTVSHLLLGLVYFGVMTPIGVVMRLLGRNPMTPTFDRGATTYWQTRSGQTPAERYFRQF